MISYLQEPYELITDMLPWQKAGLSYTATGYGAKIPSTRCVVLPDGRKRRVYITIYSNIGSAWIILDHKKLFLR
jgi:hypothetical protein